MGIEWWNTSSPIFNRITRPPQHDGRVVNSKKELILAFMLYKKEYSKLTFGGLGYYRVPTMVLRGLQLRLAQEI